MNELRAMNVRPHVAQNLTRRGGSAIDGRTTRHRGYAASQRIRKRIEEGFGWMKTVAGLDRPMGARYRPGRLGVHLRCGCLQSRAPPQAARGDAFDGAAPGIREGLCRALAHSSRWTPWSDDVLDVGGEGAPLVRGGLKTARSPSSPSRHSSMSATARETGKRLQSSPSRVSTRKIRSADVVGPVSEPPGASSGTSTSTTATILASSASRDDFFNSLLGIDFDECGADRAMAQDFAQNPAIATADDQHVPHGSMPEEAAQCAIISW